MRTLIDIPERQLVNLSEICAAKKLSRAEAVRQAIDVFIEQNRISRETAFGIWRGQQIALPGDERPLPADGLAYQERLREEW
jgi:hypothetical protein